MEDMLEYDVALFMLADIRDTVKENWPRADFEVKHALDRRSTPRGFTYSPRNLYGVSIRKVCLIKATVSYEPGDVENQVVLELFHEATPLLNGSCPTGGYHTVRQAMEALVSKLIELAPDRSGNNKTGEALAALRA